MAKPIVLVGQVFGRLTVLEALPERSSNRSVIWRCLCRCGCETAVNGSRLRRGTTQSCGCLNREQVSILHRTHGRKNTTEYRIWTGMWSRCTNLNHPQYPNY